MLLTDDTGIADLMEYRHDVKPLRLTAGSKDTADTELDFEDQ